MMNNGLIVLSMMKERAATKILINRIDNLVIYIRLLGYFYCHHPEVTEKCYFHEITLRKSHKIGITLFTHLTTCYNIYI